MTEGFGMFRPRYLVPALLALMIGGTALAAPPGERTGAPDGSRHGPPSAEELLARLDRALDLSDEQSAQILEMLQAAEAERRALHDEIMEQFRPQLCALRNDTDAGILSLLTPEQADSYEQLKEQRRERRGGPGGFDCDEPDS